MFANSAHFRKMKNINIPILAIDFEGSRRIGVVEYGVAKIENGAVSELRTGICAPKTKIPQRDAEFFGIDNEEAFKHPPFSESVAEFCEMRKTGIFAAHNASVEDGLLRDAAPAPAIVPDFAFGGMRASWSPWIDSCALLKKIFPTLDSAKLSSAIDAFGLKAELDALAEKFCPPSRKKWHCAPYDALACALLIIGICRMDGFENATVEWLAKHSAAPRDTTASLF